MGKGKREMSNRHNVTITLKLVFSACLVFMLSACSDGNDNITTTESVTEVPEFIQSIAALNVGAGTLSASIKVNDDPPIPMTISDDGLTSSASVTLSMAVHTVTITFEFTEGTEAVTLATATKQIDLSNGSASLSFADADYTTTGDGFDNDNDGFSNLAEIIANTNPTDELDTPLTCLLDDTNSLIGSCALG